MAALNSSATISGSSPKKTASFADFILFRLLRKASLCLVLVITAGSSPTIFPEAIFLRPSKTLSSPISSLRDIAIISFFFRCVGAKSILFKTTRSSSGFGLSRSRKSASVLGSSKISRLFAFFAHSCARFIPSFSMESVDSLSPAVSAIITG